MPRRALTLANSRVPLCRLASLRKLFLLKDLLAQGGPLAVKVGGVQFLGGPLCAGLQLQRGFLGLYSSLLAGFLLLG